MLEEQKNHLLEEINQKNSQTNLRLNNHQNRTDQLERDFNERLHKNQKLLNQQLDELQLTTQKEAQKLGNLLTDLTRKEASNDQRNRDILLKVADFMRDTKRKFWSFGQEFQDYREDVQEQIYEIRAFFLEEMNAEKALSEMFEKLMTEEIEKNQMQYLELKKQVTEQLLELEKSLLDNKLFDKNDQLKKGSGLQLIIDEMKQSSRLQ